jgi:hypothetical protein|tara:strand:+ start:1709 stop:2029 length:321 start_codon:yes stop_codon:yes gene_type:complete
MSDNNNKQKEYHVTLHATGFESGSGFKGFDSCRAWFDTAAPVGSDEFNKLREEKIEFFAKQQLRHGWTGYKVGVTEVKAGSKAISRMSPAWDYGHRTEAVFDKIDI